MLRQEGGARQGGRARLQVMPAHGLDQICIRSCSKTSSEEHSKSSNRRRQSRCHVLVLLTYVYSYVLVVVGTYLVLVCR